MGDERSVFQKIGDAVTNYAPGLAGILALVPGVGTVPAAALAAVGALGRAVGLGSQAKPEDVLQAISADPEIRLKAMVAENDFKAEMGRQEIEKLKTELADTQNARSREVEITKATGQRDYQLMILAWLGVFLPFVLVIAMIKWGIPDMTPEEALMVGGFVGIIVGEYKTIFGYFFGSSRSSSDKTEIMGQMRKQIKGER